MKMINEKIINELKKEFPKGCRVELIMMDDVQSPPLGTKGTVTGVDDMGSIMVDWDTGSKLSIVFGEDECRRVNLINDIVIEQIIKIRDTGLTNMFDTNTVQKLAYENNYYELVAFIEEYRNEYTEFILHGKK